MPTNSIAHGLVSATTCATRTPRPPSTRCSSATTMARVSAAARAMVSRSSGFAVCISTTRAEMPSPSSTSAASSACATSNPFAMIVTSRPAATSIALPISKRWSPPYKVGAFGRPVRMNTGPTCAAAARTSAFVAASSAGAITTNPGREQASPISSMLICEGPSSPIEIPLCVPTTFRFTKGYAAHTRSCSKPLFMANAEKLETNGILPPSASPAPTAVMLASAIPNETNRSGNSFWKYTVMVDLERSASHTTMSLFSRPSSTSTRPKASRVAAPSLIANLVFAAILLQLLKRQFHFIRRRRRAVELGIVLHKRNAFAFDGVRHNAGGLALGGFGLVKRFLDGRKSVAVDLDGVPPESPPFFGQRRDLHDVVHEAVELDPVVVHNRHHVVELVERARHGGFPDLAFLDLAVAQHGVGAARPSVQPCRQAHPQSHRKTFAQRSGGGLQRRYEPHVRVALIYRAELAQRVQPIERRIGVPRLRHGAIQHRRRVPFGKNKSVPVHPLRVLRLDPHSVEIEFDHNLHGRKRTARVAGLGRANHLNDLPPDPLGGDHQLVYGFRHGGTNSHSTKSLEIATVRSYPLKLTNC